MEFELKDYCAKSEGECEDDLKLGTHVFSTLKRLDEIYKMNNTYPERLVKLAAKTLILHDLGKISPDFQNEIISRISEKKFKNYKIQLRNVLKGQRKCEIDDHEILSLVWAVGILGNSDEDRMIRTAILYHHYNEFYAGQRSFIKSIYSVTGKLQEYAKFIKTKFYKFPDFINIFLSEEFSEPIKNAIKELKDSYEQNKSNFENLESNLKKAEDISRYFSMYLPNFGDFENPSKEFYEFFELMGLVHRSDHAASANVSLISEQPPVVLEKIEQTFLSEKGNSVWQAEVLKSKNGENLKAMVLVAPTGSGKTEFALMWAKMYEKQLIYTLPLRVALDDLYSNRIKKYLDDDIKFEENVALLHSTSYLEYLKNETEEIERRITESRLFKTPIIFSTVDQVMLSSLYYYQFDILFSLYPNASIVIDEIQAYTPDMMAIILNTMEHILNLRGNLLVITATLPPYLKEFFEDREFHIIDFSKESCNNLKNSENKRHKIKVIDGSIIEKKDENLWHVSERFIEDVKKYSAQNSVLIILNTVKRAIAVYKELKNHLKDKLNDNIFLLHSRLVTRKKKENENKMREKLEREEKIILVATQIVEASVDLDFDFLFTELSPIDSQIQRWGRVFRNCGKNYEGNDANIIIYLQQGDEVKKLYDEKVLEATKEVLKGKNGILFDFKEEVELINKVFDEKLKEDYRNRIENYQKYFKEFNAVKRSDAQRLFRGLATRTVVIKKLVEKQLPDLVKIISNDEMTWEEICKGIYEGEEKEIAKYRIKSILLENSVTLPKGLKIENLKRFKDFEILDINIDENDMDRLLEFGIDEIEDKIKISAAKEDELCWIL